MKKNLSLLLAAAILLSILCTAVFAVDENVNLDYTVRDFNADGLLFEGTMDSSSGMVSDTLGADGKPVYNLDLWRALYGDDVSQSRLDALFNDVDGVNKSARKTLTMAPDGEGFWVIDSSVDAQGNSLDGFFPIDGELFGNEENEHNYHFSVEIHTRFKYVQNAEFEFCGDDDVWVFFNDKLVMDLGGVHSEMRDGIQLDLIASELGIEVGDTVKFDMFYMERHLSGSNLYIRTNFEFLNLDASEWAKSELEKADSYGLIPDSLRNADLTQPITRAEFAAVSVKAYEALSEVKASPAESNPFTDTDDAEVLKAYAAGITAGVSADKFAPDDLLNREQAATMLTRVFKRVSLPGWTLATDADFALEFTKPEPFADDADISGWAKDSVYFMAANGIIKGMGDNKFAPKNVTTADEAAHYANATREQALIIAARMVENLK